MTQPIPEQAPYGLAARSATPDGFAAWREVRPANPDRLRVNPGRM